MNLKMESGRYTMIYETFIDRMEGKRDYECYVEEFASFFYLNS